MLVLFIILDVELIKVDEDLEWDEEEVVFIFIF